jgi:Na+/H+ antiporter
MALFESTLLLLLVAVVLLRLSSKLRVPYPSMLALAGACAAALPSAPTLAIEPHLALVLFIAPSLLDAAYDTSPRELRANWFPLVALVLVAVVLTAAAVAWAGWAVAGLPLAAAVTLGAIVAPPDAAAAAALLKQFNLPRRLTSILQGESLLNDAVALLIFGVAVRAAVSPEWTAGDTAHLIFAVPGGIVAGYLFAKLYLKFAPEVAGTLSSSIAEFVATFGAWIVAEHLHISPILTIVALGMTLAIDAPNTQRARDRIHSYSVWGAVVFVLNVLAFLIMGLQARAILASLQGAERWQALGFACLVFAIVIAVRCAWVFAYAAFVRRFHPFSARVPSNNSSVLISWCGIRGLVTLATAFALPHDFPGRNVIVLCAFVVVFGTLVVQGFTMGPLIRRLSFEPDNSLQEELSTARQAMINAVIDELANQPGDAAAAVKAEYEAAASVARDVATPQETEHDRIRTAAVSTQRKVLAAMRHEGKISDEAFHELVEELDWSEMNAAPTGRYRMVDG